MKRHSKIILAIASLGLAMLACQALTGGGDNNTPVAPVDTNVPVLPTNTTSSTGNVILSDDFSTAQWGTGTDTNSAVEYANETLQMIVFTKNYFVWSTPNDQDYQNVHMEVTVLNNGTDSTTAFGLMCNQQPGVDNSFYYFAVTAAGQYAIAKAEEGADADIFLTNNDEWATSDLIVKNATSYRIGADCGNGTLALYVDGQPIVSVSDSSFSNGGVAVFTWSGEEATTTDVSFDDFEMRGLP